MRETIYAYNNSYIKQYNPSFAFRDKLNHTKKKKRRIIIKDSTPDSIGNMDLEEENSKRINQKLNEEFEQKLFYNYFRLPDDYSAEELVEEPRPVRSWVHLTCAYWTPGIEIEQGIAPKFEKNAPESEYQLELVRDEYTNPMTILGLENVDERRFQIPCQLCHRSEGAVIQCVSVDCLKSYHPECARRSKVLLTFDHQKEPIRRVHCEQHTKLQIKKDILEVKERKETDILKFTKALDKFYATYCQQLEETEEESPIKPSTKASRSRRSQKSRIREIYLVEYYRAIAKEMDDRGEAFV